MATCSGRILHFVSRGTYRSWCLVFYSHPALREWLKRALRNVLYSSRLRSSRVSETRDRSYLHPVYLTLSGCRPATTADTAATAATAANVTISIVMPTSVSSDTRIVNTLLCNAILSEGEIRWTDLEKSYKPICSRDIGLCAYITEIPVPCSLRTVLASLLSRAMK